MSSAAKTKFCHNEKQIIPHGICNTGNSCYMNSALQFLFASTPFLDAYDSCSSVQTSKADKKTVGEKIKSWKNEQLGSKHQSFHDSMADLATQIRTTKIDYTTAKQFRRIGAHDDRKFNNGSQQDALEYFLHILRQIETSLPATHSNEQNNPCESLKIELCEKIERGDSNHYVLRKEYVLSCPLVTKDTKDKDSEYQPEQTHNDVAHPTRPKGDKRSGKKKEDKPRKAYSSLYDDEKTYILKDCIDQFMTREDILTSGQEAVFKTSGIASLSAYIVIQPRIFVINRWGTPEKLNVKMDVPDELSFKEHMCPDEWLRNGDLKLSGQNRKLTEYRLKAFVTHHGWTTLGGHYVCHVRQGDTWYHCNDSHVSKVNISSLPKRDGYFFLYESMQHSVEKCTEHQGVSGEHIQHYQHKDNEAGVEASTIESRQNIWRKWAVYSRPKVLLCSPPVTAAVMFLFAARPILHAYSEMKIQKSSVDHVDWKFKNVMNILANELIKGDGENFNFKNRDDLKVAFGDLPRDAYGCFTNIFSRTKKQFTDNEHYNPAPYFTITIGRKSQGKENTREMQYILRLPRKDFKKAGASTHHPSDTKRSSVKLEQCIDELLVQNNETGSNKTNASEKYKLESLSEYVYLAFEQDQQGKGQQHLHVPDEISMKQWLRGTETQVYQDYILKAFISRYGNHSNSEECHTRSGDQWHVQRAHDIVTFPHPNEARHSGYIFLYELKDIDPGYTATQNNTSHAQRSPPGNCLVEPAFEASQISHASSVNDGRGSPPGNCLVQSEIGTTPEASAATNLQGDDGTIASRPAIWGKWAVYSRPKVLLCSSPLPAVVMFLFAARPILHAYAEMKMQAQPSEDRKLKNVMAILAKELSEGDGECFSVKNGDELNAALRDVPWDLRRDVYGCFHNVLSRINKHFKDNEQHNPVPHFTITVSRQSHGKQKKFDMEYLLLLPRKDNKYSKKAAASTHHLRDTCESSVKLEECIDELMVQNTETGSKQTNASEKYKLESLSEYVYLVFEQGQQGRGKQQLNIPDEISMKRWLRETENHVYKDYILKAFVTRYGNHSNSEECHTRSGDQWHVQRDCDIVKLPHPNEARHSGYMFLYELNDTDLQK